MLLLSTFTVCAQQGIVNFSNLGPDDRKIYIQTASAPNEQIALASGSGFAIALYWGPAGTTDMNSLMRVGPHATFLTGDNAGMFIGGTRTITSPGPGPNGAVYSFQARAWELSGGSTWEEVVASGSARAGWGPVFDFDTKDPFNMLESVPTIGNAPGWRGFVMGYDSSWIIPEPSTTALCVIGGAALLVLRRKKK